MILIKTSPYSIKFKDIFKWADYASSQLNTIPHHTFIEDIVEVFFKIKLDYDEETDFYVIYFKNEHDMILFKLKYSGLLFDYT